MFEEPYVPLAAVDAALEPVVVEWHVSDTSDQQETKDRWTEVTIYRLESAAFLVAGAGRSQIPGETSRYWLHFCPTADDLLKVFLRPHNRGGPVPHLPVYARNAMEAAAHLDREVRNVLAQWDTVSRWGR